jgi:solute carrier family 25 phosphate transporter 3
MFSPKYYVMCAGGGLFSDGTMYLLITPLDMLKVTMHVNYAKYSNIWFGLGVLREQSPASLWKGQGEKIFGYGVLGGYRFGFHE